MAVLAGVIAGYMVLVFARCNGAVMTGRTGSLDIGMVKRGRGPGIGCMAVLAVVAAFDVFGRFARRFSAVMAGRTGAGNITVVKAGNLHPAGSKVATFAITVGCNMARRHSLAPHSGSL